MNHDAVARRLEGLEVVLTFALPRRPAPDRVRSFLQHLQQLDRPFRVVGFPDNLFTLSDGLSGGGEVSCQLVTGGAPRQARVAVRVAKPGSEIVVDLGPLQGLSDTLLAPSTLELLVSGARMLGCDRAALAIAAEVGDGIDKPDAIAMAPVAMWINGSRPHPDSDTPGMTLVREDRDGARLMLTSPLAASGPWAIVSSLMQGLDHETSIAILAKTMRSSDWRIRVAAMIEVARREIRSLGLEVKRMEIPSTSTPGIDSAMRHHLLAIQKASMLLLAGEPVPDMSEEAADTRSGIRAHVLRAVAGRSLAFRDEFAEIVDSLVGPAL